MGYNTKTQVEQGVRLLKNTINEFREDPGAVRDSSETVDGGM